MKTIELTGGGKIIGKTSVDDDVFEEIKETRWYLLQTKQGCRYAYRIERDGRRRLCRFLHRDIMKCTVGDGKIIDHINRDGLDNTRANLRFVNWTESNQNRSIQRVAGQWRSVG